MLKRGFLLATAIAVQPTQGHQNPINLATANAVLSRLKGFSPGQVYSADRHRFVEPRSGGTKDVLTTLGNCAI